MLWQPAYPGDFPTLGGEIIQYIQERCVIPDGEQVGDPFLLTEEMKRFVLWFYRVDEETGRRFTHHRGGQLVRPQKWGKGPFSAAIICAESEADVLPDGFNAQRQPVGRPWSTPWVQVTAVSEDQTDNVWRALVPMIELGDIAADIPDTGETRINLPNGGKIEPVTSSARSRLGQRITHALQDETHAWTKQNGGRKLADNQRRNLAGMGGRWLETTNAWDPAEESVAQQTFESNEPGVYRDDVEPGLGSIRNKRERRHMLRKVYGDSRWVDLDRIEGEIEALLPRDPAQAERYFLNRKRAAEDAAFDLEQWNKLVLHRDVPKGALIVIGVDGARFDDALALVATEVETGHQWPLGIWTRPESASDDYEHPLREIDGAMAEAYEAFDVWRVYVDPQWIDYLMDLWQGRWGGKTTSASQRGVFPWYTNKPRAMAFSLSNYRAAMQSGSLTHNGDPVFTQHIANAKRQNIAVFDEEHRPMWLISKDRPMSPRKIDAAMAGCLSWEARGDAIAAAAKPLKKKRAQLISF